MVARRRRRPSADAPRGAARLAVRPRVRRRPPRRLGLVARRLRRAPAGPRGPGYARAWAFFSPAVSSDDPALDDLSALSGVPLAFWCGTEDGFYDDVRSVVDRLPDPPEITVYERGGHTRAFWNDHTLEAFAWLGESLGER